MKVWNGFGGEHSAKLRIVGTFETESDASNARAIIDALSEVSWEVAQKIQNDREFTREVLDLLVSLNFMSVGHDHLAHFHFEFDMKQAGNQLEIRTDELTLEAFALPMLNNGATIKIFSEHNWPGST